MTKIYVLNHNQSIYYLFVNMIYIRLSVKDLVVYGLTDLNRLLEQEYTKRRV